MLLDIYHLIINMHVQSVFEVFAASCLQGRFHAKYCMNFFKSILQEGLEKTRKCSSNCRICCVQSCSKWQNYVTEKLKCMGCLKVLILVLVFSGLRVSKEHGVFDSFILGCHIKAAYIKKIQKVELLQEGMD